MVSLQPISATSACPLLPSQVVSICDLQRLALYWFHAPGLQLDNKVSQSTDQPHGTVCHQHYSHWTCLRAPSSGHWRHTCSRSPPAHETSSWLWRRSTKLIPRARQIKLRASQAWHRYITWNCVVCVLISSIHTKSFSDTSQDSFFQSVHKPCYTWASPETICPAI